MYKNKICGGCRYFEEEVSYCERFECDTREHSIACNAFEPIEDKERKMRKKCIWCGCEVNPNVIQGMYYCPRCDEDLTDQDVLPMTVFDKITESVETLAEKLVYMRVVSWDDEVNWYSVVLRSYCFRTKEEAIAATIEELNKEVLNENSN